MDMDQLSNTSKNVQNEKLPKIKLLKVFLILGTKMWRNIVHLFLDRSRWLVMNKKVFQMFCFLQKKTPKCTKIHKG